MDIKRLERRLIRMKERIYRIEKIHKGNEQNFTYHGGFNLGYLRGRVCELEDILDDINDKDARQ
jgi:hypothetical protein